MRAWEFIKGLMEYAGFPFCGFRERSPTNERERGLDIVVKQTIGFGERYRHSNLTVNGFDGRATFQWMDEIKRLGCAHDLDGKDRLGIFHDLEELCRTCSSH